MNINILATLLILGLLVAGCSSYETIYSIDQPTSQNTAVPSSVQSEMADTSGIDTALQELDSIDG